MMREMVWRLVAIGCVVVYGLLPCGKARCHGAAKPEKAVRVTPCGKRIETPRGCPGRMRTRACGCARRTTPGASQGRFQIKPKPERSKAGRCRGSSDCRHCGQCVPRQPWVPAEPGSKARVVLVKQNSTPITVHAVEAQTLRGAVPEHSGLDPPGASTSHNVRQAEIEVWLN
jgi:hypothetical protein